MVQQEDKPFLNRYAFNKKLVDFLNNSNYLSAFKKAIALVIITYCINLIAVEVPTAVSITDEIGIVSHDVLNRALSAIGDDSSMIIMFIIQHVKPQTAISGCLIIDDVIIRKPYGPKLPYISKIYDHTTGTYVKGYQLLISSFTMSKQ